MAKNSKKTISRRSFIGTVGAGGLALLYPPWARRLQADPDAFARIFHAAQIPAYPFTEGNNRHAGVEALLALMADQGLTFFRSAVPGPLAGPEGMIAAGDVVLVKVNAQWKYRGCTNSDVIRGLIQKILEHPDGFSGEVVLVENGQGRGSLNCDTSASYGNDDVHANAVDERNSFLHLVNVVFADPRVSAFLFDPIRSHFIASDDHQADGYRRFENVSYPCFTTAGGRRVELREGVWNGEGYDQNLKLINVPVLKNHGGSEITAAMKHMYGLLSMADGNVGERHYQGLGEACGKMMVSVRPPVLNIIDAIWVSHIALAGYPAAKTSQVNALAASQDPVALDYWAAKHILYPIDGNLRHHPDRESIQRWLRSAEATINQRGGLYHPEWGITAGQVTRDESRMSVYSVLAGPPDSLVLTSPNGGQSWARGSRQTVTWGCEGSPGSNLKILLLKGGLIKLTLSSSAPLAAGSFTWKVPSDLPRGNNYTIRIVSRQKATLSDASDGPFSIAMAPPGTSLALTSPVGGESWQRGTSQNIAWTYVGQPGAAVRIVLLKSGSVDRVIAAAAPAGETGTGSFAWPIPANLARGSDYRIRVQSVLYPDCRTQSARNFAITR
jgi:uncharacterized protein (DUF362 family)